jgi:hypothetical protein
VTIMKIVRQVSENLVEVLLQITPLLLLATFAQGEDIYVAQLAQGADTGADAANAHSVAWFNTAANWGAGANRISAGDTVHLRGNIISNLIVQSSGSPGNVITILFEPKASMIKAAWTGSIFDVSFRSYITIDGGATGLIGSYAGKTNYINGLIQSTNSGSGLGFTNYAIGVYGKDATFITVKNLAIKDLFVRRSGTGAAGGGTGVNAFWNGGTSPSDWTVTNCVFKDMSTGFFMDYGPGSKNILYSHCTAYNVNWGGAAGDHGSSASLTNLVVRDCYFHDFTNWDQPANSYHHDGFYAWAESGGKLYGVTMFNNVVGPNFSMGLPNNATSGLFVSGAGVTNTILMYNNLFLENTNGGPSNGDILVWPGNGSTTRILNNTFIGCGGGNAMQLYGKQGGTQTYEVMNNLCLRKTFINVAYGQYISLLASKNLGYNLPSRQEYSFSTSSSSAFKSLAQWQALGYDVGGFSSDPNLDSNYVPQSGSPAINAGADLSAYFATDKNGKIRVGAWDIGAFEFWPGHNPARPTSPKGFKALP